MPSTKVLAAIAACLVGGTAAAKVHTETITYKAGDTVLKGVLAWNDTVSGRRPGVLVVHEWWGLNQHARAQAERLARDGYVAFALDMFGNGKVATHPKDAMAFVQEATKDPAVAAARFNAGLEVLKRQPRVDPEKIAVFGYCFGGGVALNMARAGADVAAIVTFHGSLEPADGPAQPGKVKPAILVQAGGADPMVPPHAVQAFEEEMKNAGANVKVIMYPNAKHSFTNPDADKSGVEGLAYDREADRESWTAAMKFLHQVFG
jgi:dienelactone hydrolase